MTSSLGAFSFGFILAGDLTPSSLSFMASLMREDRPGELCGPCDVGVDAVVALSLGMLSNRQVEGNPASEHSRIPHELHALIKIPLRHAELGTALPSRQRGNMLRNATFFRIFKFGKLCFRRKVLYQEELWPFVSSHFPDSPEFAHAVKHGVHESLYHLPGKAKPREDPGPILRRHPLEAKRERH